MLLKNANDIAGAIFADVRLWGLNFKTKRYSHDVLFAFSFLSFSLSLSVFWQGIGDFGNPNAEI